MKVKIVGSTNGIKTKSSALKFNRAAARVCYSDKPFEVLSKEEDRTSLTERTLKSGHHSVHDHVMLNLEISDIPKFGAMLLNNEKMCTTSEKSARYTKMELEGSQKELYDRWMGIFKDKIKAGYSGILSDQRIEKLAQENARYLTSVFTPTQMVHTVSIRQANYIMNYFGEFVAEAPDTRFNAKVKSFMEEFNNLLERFYIENLESMNDRHLSMFAKRPEFATEFGENYSTTYQTSFACLAQLHRHRTLDYEMQPISDCESPDFFVPLIIQDDDVLVERWITDMGRASESDWPQGMLITVHESGKYTDFISKMHERLCGQAQLEIMRRTKATLNDYLDATFSSNKEIYEDLVKYGNGPRCTFAKCRGACEFGKDALERLI